MTFLSQFTGFFKKIGFWLGSSRWLARALVKHSGLRNKSNIKILELGAGYGNVTKEILKHLGTDAVVIAIENDEERIAYLEHITTDTTIEIIHADAQDLDQHVTAGSIDVVISTLPLGSLEQAVTEDILKKISLALKHGGKYIQYQYWMANKKDVKKVFHMEGIRFEPRNFSPAFIYVTEKR